MSRTVNDTWGTIDEPRMAMDWPVASRISFNAVAIVVRS